MKDLEKIIKLLENYDLDQIQKHYKNTNFHLCELFNMSLEVSCESCPGVPICELSIDDDGFDVVEYLKKHNVHKDHPEYFL